MGAIEKIFSIAAAAFAQPTCAFDDLVLEEPLSGPSGIVLPRLDGGYGTSFSFSSYSAGLDAGHADLRQQCSPLKLDYQRGLRRPLRS